MSRNHIVLVHGTFAADASWVDQSSALARELRKSLPSAHIEAFRWSGNNSHSARQDAANRLAMLIKEKAQLRPETKFYIISHSHGGNIALMAAKLMEGSAQFGGMAFLGTPFLVNEDNDIENRFGFVKSTATLVLPWVFVALFIALYAMNAEKFVSTWGYFFGISDVSKICLAVSLLLSMCGTIGIASSFGERLSDFVIKVIVNRQEECRQFFAKDAPPCPVFIATVPRDEAGALLSVIDRLTYAPQYPLMILRFLLSFAAAGMVVFFMSSLAFYLIAKMAFDRDFSEDIIASTAPIAIILIGAAILYLSLALIALILTSLIRGLPISFGGEDVIMVAATRVRADILPPWRLPPNSIANTYEFRDRPWFRLRHSTFYSDSRVIADLSRWLVCPSSSGAAKGDLKSKSRNEGRYELLGLAIMAMTILVALTLSVLHAIAHERYAVLFGALDSH